MDCRTSLVLALAFLTACAGCNATRISKAPALAWLQKKKTPELPKSNAHPFPTEEPKEETSLFPFAKKEPEVRKPKVATCIAWAVFREKSARMASTDPEKQQLLDEARRAYQQALEREPKNMEALAGLARVYTDMGKADQALEIFAKSVKEYPKEPGVWFTLGEHYKLKKDWNEAAKSYYQAHQLDPENRRYMQWLGFALASAGQHDEGFTWLSKANGPATAHYNLAQLCKELGEEEACRKHLRQALDINPAHAEATVLLERITNPTPARSLPPTPSNPTPTTASLPPSTGTSVSGSSPLTSLPPSLPPSTPVAPVAQIGFSPTPVESLPPHTP